MIALSYGLPLRLMEDSAYRYWDGCVSDSNKLMTSAKDGEPVRIWYSDAPYSMCGFRYTQLLGKARMEMKAALTYACLDLKKLAKKRWHERR